MGKETSIRKKSTKTPAKKRKSPAAGKKKTTRVARPQPWTHVQCTLFLLGISLLFTIFIILTLYLFILLDIPNLQSIKDYQPKMASLVLDREHKVIKRTSGVDIWSIFRAFFHNIRAGAKSHGGSTITQQVTRSLLLSRKKVYSRKVKEAILAYRIDSVMSKDDILYIYLNQIYLGEGAFGVEAAARTYFDRRVENFSYQNPDRSR